MTKKFTATVELSTNDDSCGADLMRMRLRRSITVGAAQLFADGIPLGQVKAVSVEESLSATDAKETTQMIDELVWASKHLFRAQDALDAKIHDAPVMMLSEARVSGVLSMIIRSLDDGIEDLSGRNAGDVRMHTAKERR